jgi:hypothetical protein
MRPVLRHIHPRKQACLHRFQFGSGEPTFTQGFLPANLVALQKMANALQSPGAGDVVANQIKDAGGIGHAFMMERIGKKARNASLREVSNNFAGQSNQFL